jgi:hypothetical protein
MIYWPRAVWGVFVLAALGGRTEPVLPPAQVLRWGVFPSREDMVQIHGNNSVYLDREGLHVAVVAHAGNTLSFTPTASRDPPTMPSAG